MFGSQMCRNVGTLPIVTTTANCHRWTAGTQFIAFMDPKYLVTLGTIPHILCRDVTIYIILTSLS